VVADKPSAWQAWTMVTIVTLGFLVGGLGVIYGWPLFWAGVGVVAAGIVYGRIIHVMEFTEEYSPEPHRVVEPGTTRFHG
jgi:hypothetical protein